MFEFTCKKKENAFENILKVIQNTLDINKTQDTIIDVVGKTIKADRCFIVNFDKKSDQFLPIEHEYLSSKKITSCIGLKVEEIVPNLVAAAKKGEFMLVKNREIFLNGKKQNFAIEQETFEKNSIHSIIAIPLFYRNDLLGVLSVHYVDKNRELNKGEINLIKDIAKEVAVAINYANLYKSNQIQLERARLLRKIIEVSRQSLILEDLLRDICKEIVDLFDIQRVSIGKFLKNEDNDAFLTEEYISTKEIKTSKDHRDFNEVIQYWKDYLEQEDKSRVIENVEESDLPLNVINIYKEMGVKCIICIPLGTKEFIWGGLFLAEHDYSRGSIKENIEFFETIASQVYIAIRQSELFKREREAFERETLLRNIIEAIRNTLDIDELETIIVTEIAKALNADRCFIMEYNKETDGFLPIKAEYLRSAEIPSIIGFDLKKELPELLEKNKNHEKIIITNIEKFFAQNNFYGTRVEKHFREYQTLSGFSLPISYGDELLGLLAIHYSSKEGEFIEEEQQLVESLASQIGIAINQARLYKKEIMAKERGEMIAEITEIIRKSLDKTMIKKLFVKNIRKYFNADIVYLAEYDTDIATFLPVDKEAEALSIYKEKTFVDYDWSKGDCEEYIRPLLNKEELNISDVDEYILKEEKSNELIDFFESANIKSSYNFPIIHYKKIIGFLSINFTGNVHVLSNDDIESLRNICMQVGIALYQADLYLNAQQCFFSKKELLKAISNKIEGPVKSILYESTHLAEDNLEREHQIQNIINNCHVLMDATKDIKLNTN